MIARRLLVYFLIAAAVAVTTMVVLQIYALRRATRRSVRYHLLLARNIGRFMSNKVLQQGRRLRDLLEAPAPPSRTDHRLARMRRAPLASGGLAIFGLDGRLHASNVEPRHLIPKALLLRAQRRARAQTSGYPLITRLWHGSDGRPLLALVITGRDRTAVAHVVLDGPLFLRGFHVFAMHRHSSLQVLDDQGVAIFATRPADRFRKTVGRPCLPLRAARSTNCATCHAARTLAAPRRDVTSVAPIFSTPWRIVVRESERDLNESVREITYSSLALVGVILTVFLGVFLLLWRHILRPLRQLVAMAAGLARPSDPAFPGSRSDEFETLAHSLQAISSRYQAGAAQPAGLLDEIARQQRAELRETLETLLAALPNMPGIASAFVLLHGSSHDLLVSSHVAFGSAPQAIDERALRQTLTALARQHETLSVAALADALGAAVTAQDTGGFAIRRTTVFGSIEVSVWLGLAGPAPERNDYVSSALELLATQARSLLERHLLYEQLQQEHRQKNRMLQHLFEAEDEERRRIAREIHDETAQVLSALLVLLETFPLIRDAPAQLERLARAKALVEQSLDQAHRLVRRLRPAALEELGLVDAVRALGQDLLVDSGIDFGLEVDLQPGVTLARQLEVATYRVFQEAMTNVLRHARAGHVRSWLAIDELGLRARISDDGVGLRDESKELHERPHWGLLGMRERVLQLGGSITFARAEPSGLCIDIAVPSTSRQAAAHAGADTGADAGTDTGADAAEGEDSDGPHRAR